MKDKLLPQANSLEKVINVFIYVSVAKTYTLAEIAQFCDFDPRQASYYLNACKYLDLLTDDGELSALGQSIIDKYETPHNAIYERIMTDSIIGKIFAHMLLFPNEDIKQFSYNLLAPLYPQYGEAVIIRRASSLKSWCDEIISHLNKK